VTDPEKTQADGTSPDQQVSAPSVSTAPAQGPARGRFSRIPSHLGRARTSTVVLAVLFVAIFALYLQIKPAEPGTASTSTDTGTEQPAPAPAPTTTAPETPVEPTTSAPETTSVPTTEAEPTTSEEPTDTSVPAETSQSPQPTTAAPTTRAPAPTTASPTG